MLPHFPEYPWLVTRPGRMLGETGFALSLGAASRVFMWVQGEQEAAACPISQREIQSVQRTPIQGGILPLMAAQLCSGVNTLISGRVIGAGHSSCRGAELPGPVVCCGCHGPGEHFGKSKHCRVVIVVVQVQ